MSLLQFSHRARARFERSAFLAAFSSPPRSLLLTPSGARLLRDGSLRGDTVDEHFLQAAATESTSDISSALAAFEQLLTPQHGGRVRIVLSDLWVRYSLIWVEAATTLDDVELLALARGQLSRQHPDTSEWPLRGALQGNTLLAAASPPDMLDGLHALADKFDVCLVGIEPLFSYLRDNSQIILKKLDGWLLLEEPGLIMAAFVRAGRISALHSARQNDNAAATALSLLERQSALLGIAAGDVSLFTYSARPLTLPLPWRIGELVRY